MPYIKEFRLYFSATNLYTFTSYTGLDPETSYSGLEYGVDQYDLYPKIRSFSFGLDLKF